MANKATSFSYRGMNQDTSKSLFPNSYYFEGRNIRILATDAQSSGAVTNEKGNIEVYQIPMPTIDHDLKEISYNDKILKYETDELDDIGDASFIQFIVGHAVTRRYFILFTTDENGFDCIWKVDLDSPTFEITLLYLRSMLFSREHPIQALNNFENKIVDKVYWVDGLHQLRFINIEHSIENEDLENLIDVPLATIDMVGKFDPSQPLIINILPGGTHTAGMIQYAYNLYRVNSSQSKLSPLSELIPLDKDILGGGALNEVVGATPVVHIREIDPNYTHIRVYSIKYTSYNELPTISLIDDREIPSSRNLEVFDDGETIGSVTLEEFLFLGSDIIIPKHINSKYNRLFFANYDERNYNVELDVRAYSFNNVQACTVYDTVKLYQLGDPTPDVDGLTGTPLVISPITFDNPDDKFDSVNLQYDIYKYQATNNTLIGGEGKYLTYELEQTILYDPDARYFKDSEIYRLGIEFINSFGQYSLPKWVADFKAPVGNLSGNYNILRVTLKPEFYTWLGDDSNFLTEYDKPVGYRVLLGERTINDKTIVANGLISPMMLNDKSTKDVEYPADKIYVRDKADSIPKLPNMLLRNTGVIPDVNGRYFGDNTRPLALSNNLAQMCMAKRTADTEFPRAFLGDKDTFGRFYQYNAMYQLYSPELIFNESVPLSTGLVFKVKGGLLNKYNTVWGKTFTSSAEVPHEGKGLNGVSLNFASTFSNITGDGRNTTSNGIICHPLGNDPNYVAFTSFYRGYGNVSINDTFTPNSNIVAFNVPINLVVGSIQPPGYSNETIRLAVNNTDIIFTTFNTARKIELSFDITPDVGFELINYTASLCSDQEGNNVLHSFSGVGNSIVSLQPADQVKDLFPASYKEYEHFLKIVVTANMSFTVDISAKVIDTITPVPSVTEVVSLNNAIAVTTSGVVAPTSFFYPTVTSVNYGVYGVPEITVKGQNVANYNNDSNYKYINTFLDIRSDKDSGWEDDGQFGRAIITGNSDANRCITFVLGPDTPATEFYDRPLMEQLHAGAGFLSTETNLGLLGEFVLPRERIYLGNIYGGNTWEDKKRTKYIEIGDYQEFDEVTPINVIRSPGDTFVNYFRFLRVIPKSPATYSQGAPSWQEIVEFYTESTVDMKNRNDVSFSTWDSKFHYLDEDYHKYNRVYSQLPNLISLRDLDFNVKKLDSFDTNIISSKEKSPGEIIDSWTDILQNEVLTLDGKFGSINAFPEFNDELFTIQDKALAQISIEPRVQVQGSDSVSIELGKGSVLYNYNYLTTDAGTLNKWGVESTARGLYFYDALNHAIYAFRSGLSKLSDEKGLHTFFANNVDLKEIRIDNPLLNFGISTGYDYVNNDVFFTFAQTAKASFTLSFNEATDSFVSFYDYIPSMYLSKGSFLMAFHPGGSRMFQQYKGKYNEFFDIKYDSHIIFNVNPEPLADCIFDNINFKSELYVAGTTTDIPEKTITHIQAYNDYQDSGLVPLIVGRNNNLRRKFRDWNALIPRESRNRVRAPWIKLKLKYDPTYNNPGVVDYQLILHQVNVYYTI